MSRSDMPDTKAGATFSSTTKAKLDEHVNSLKDTSKKLAGHAKELEKKANSLTELYRSEGQGPAFTEDTGKGNTSQQDSETKSNERDERRGPSSTPTREDQPEQTTEFTLDDLEAMLVCNK